MKTGIAAAIVVVAAPALVAGQQPAWGQCGGIGWTGGTTCVSGYTCQVGNPYYSQCVPGSGGVTTTAVRTTTAGQQTTRTTTGSQPAGTGLDALFKSKGKKYIGFAGDGSQFSNSNFVNIFRSEGSSLVAENSMKWESIHPSENTYNWGTADTLVNFAQANGKSVRGHTLLWHAQLPQWVKNINNRAQLTSAIQAHVAAVAGRYKGKIYAWDVANEVVQDGGGRRSSVFSNVFGNWEFLDVAFRAAKAADPNAKLCLNDYSIDFTGAKLNSFTSLVRELLSRGVPIDCLGTQSHITIGSGSLNSFKASLTALAQACPNCEIQITELDIGIANANSGHMSQQRTDYRTVVNACMTTSQCKGITLWGVSDSATWRSGQKPLLWDENFQKKQAYQGFVDGINSV